MDDAKVPSLLFGAGDKLEETAGVSGGDSARVCGFDVPQFSFEQLSSHFGLGDIVDSSAAAAPVGLRQFDQLQTRNGLQQSAGLSCHFLAMGQVTGLVVSDHLMLIL